MPALKPNHFITLPEDPSRSPHLMTTVKEVRTYQIRPSLASSITTQDMRASEPTKGAGSPVSLRSSPDEAGGRQYKSSSSSHTRDASLDSHVSWQSNSTNSSGYSSVALSSSRPNVSEETLVPTEHVNLPDKEEAHHGMFPISRSASKTSINAPEPEMPRSVSVSQMIRNFGLSVKTPPPPPPKPRYAHLPAHRPDQVLSEPPRTQFTERSRGNSIPNSVSFSSMEDVNYPAAVVPQARRASTTNQAHIPAVKEESGVEVIKAPDSPFASSLSRASREAQLNRPVTANSAKPVPMFRTAVHGLVLGGTKGAAETLKQQPLIEEPVPVARSVAFEDRGYGSGEIHYEGVPLADEGTAAKHAIAFDAVSLSSGLSDSKSSTGGDEQKDRLDSDTDPENLQQTKDNLTTRLSDRIALLKEEQIHIQQDIQANDELGEDIAEELAKVASSSDIARFKQHLKELEEMTSLIMSLTSRLNKIDNTLANLRSPSDDSEATTLQAKKRKLQSQHEDALYLQKGVERRRQSMRSFLSQCLPVKIFEDYVAFFTARSELLRDVRNLDDKIRLGEEQLTNLRNSGSC